MPTTLFEAPPYDPRRERRRKIKITVIIVVAIAVAVLLYLNRYWPEKHTVQRFFAALQMQNFEQAYGIWMHDPNWKQHPGKYSQYPYGQFLLDWGPSGEWGTIKSFHVKGVAAPKGNSTGVVAAVVVNGRAEPACVWVQSRDKTMSFSPLECQ